MAPEFGAKHIKKNQICIINSSIYTDRVGHWVLAAYVDGVKIYADSFKCLPNEAVRKFLNGKYYGSDTTTQDIKAESCGIKALFVAYNLGLGRTLNDILMDMDE